MTRAPFRPTMLAALALAAALPGGALPADPEAILGTDRRRAPIRARHLVAGGDFCGAEFLPGADLRHAVLGLALFNGADLRGADLSGAYLRGAQFEDARLAGANLAYADLEGVNLARADLREAVVDPAWLKSGLVLLDDTLGPLGQVLAPVRQVQPFRPPGGPILAATSAGAAGSAGALAHQQAKTGLLEGPVGSSAGRKLDQRAEAIVQADLKFFFQRHLPFGTIRELALDASWGQPRLLSVFKNSLLLHCAGDKGLKLVNPSGLARIALHEEPVDLGELEGPLFWCSTEKGMKVRFCKETRAYSDGSFEFDTDTRLVPAEWATLAPGALAVGARSVHCASGEDLYYMSWLAQDASPALKGAGGAKSMVFLHFKPKLGKLVRLGAMGSRNNRHGVLFASEKAFGRIQRTAGKNFNEHHRALSFTPNALFQGPSEAIWCANLLTREISYFHPRNSVEKDFPLAKVLASIGDLAEGPDGKLWLTDPKGEAVHCLDPGTGALQPFRMPVAGSMPYRIVNGRDGKMYCTLLGTHRLVSIAAEAKPTPGHADAKAWIPELPPRPQPPPRAPKKPAPPLFADGEDLKAAPPAAGAAAAATAPAPVLVPPSPPRPALEVRWKHILEEHGPWAANDKGHFLPGLDQASLQALFEGSLRAFGDVMALNYDGAGWILHAQCPKEIGYCSTGLGRERTRNLVLVLSLDRKTVITAYPVKRF